MSRQTAPAELPVGHLGFGAMRITGQGIWGPPTDESEAIALLRRVVDKGVTFVDTADSYGPGISEMLIAKDGSSLSRSAPAHGCRAAGTPSPLATVSHRVLSLDRERRG